MKKIYPRKRFGQHFLRDDSVLHKIANSLPSLDNDVVLEIGPGTGSLTEHLLKQTDHLIAIEIDRNLIESLTNKFDQDNFILIEEDILKVDISLLLKNNFPDKYINKQQHKAIIVGNLPYNISTPLIFHLLPQLGTIKTMLFMVQKEVADRLTATKGQKNYGRLSVMTSRLIETMHLFDVPAEAFDPPPKVMSSFIQMQLKENILHIEDEKIFSHIVSTAFSQRRKTIRNSLKNLISDDIFQKLDIASNLRAENLGVTQFSALANEISK